MFKVFNEDGSAYYVKVVSPDDHGWEINQPVVEVLIKVPHDDIRIPLPPSYYMVSTYYLDDFLRPRVENRGLLLDGATGRALDAVALEMAARYVRAETREQ